MQGDLGQCFRLSGYCGRSVTALTAIVVAGLWTIGFAPEAKALPSFARQTGQPCGTCHTDFPGLTPFGRRFKLLGYTTGGGLYRTTLFSDSKIARDANAELRSYANSIGVAGDSNANSPPPSGEKGWVPPVSMMAIVGYTHTQADLPQPSDPYKPNDNVVLTPFSGFWGGAITSNIGAFAQVTYNAPPAGGFGGSPFGHTWTWDNTDVRFASTASIGSLDLIYGITANNNPTVQDVWNTTPAWAFPYAVSNLGSTGPSATTMIEGAFAAHVGGVGVYAMINDLLYLEATGYETLAFNAQNTLGANPFNTAGQFAGVAPYWRAAIEPHWGNQSLMVGTFGMIFDINPWADPTFAAGSTATIPQTDRYTDVGVDAQYQYMGSNYWLTLRASYIREFQRLDASFGGFNPAQQSSNPTNTLNSMRLMASFAYGADNRVVFTGQYFDVSGSADAGLFGTDFNGNAMTPNSNGWTAEIAYIPYGVGKAPGWPWFNARVGLQYTYFNKFNGTTVGAQDNNTLFLHAWFAM
jgi:hypothetical protein